MDLENILSGLVRIGTVSSVDADKRIARVIYSDKDMVSGWLHVLQHYQAGVYLGKSCKITGKRGTRMVKQPYARKGSKPMTGWPTGVPP